MSPSSPPFYAHSGSGVTPASNDWQLLRDHLRNVSGRAALLAKAALPVHVGFIASATVAGWLHDLGKYREGFQRHIRGETLVNKESTYHKQAGTVQPFDAGNLPIALAILGHHGGIPNALELDEAVESDPGRSAMERIQKQAYQDCPELAGLAIPGLMETGWDRELLSRWLLSCLVDADWSDTQEHERQYKHLPPYNVPLPLDPETRLRSLLQMVERRAENCSDPSMKQIRREILEGCLAAAEHSAGLFTLTVPTGGGKTLSGLAFALKHAKQYQKRRIIYVAPYLSILDQNVQVIREALTGSREAHELIFEHYSLSEPVAGNFANETAQSAAARRAENWDAPVIVTTNVQFFESLFANTPSRCRKLHNIARSVILLDECQTLPPDLVKPTCQMLKHLTQQFGCTIVFCTATQPAFDHETLGEYRLTSREIIPTHLNLFERLRRVTLEWPASPEEALTWAQTAATMRKQKQALCIVNTRRAARELAAEFPEAKRGKSVFHLSTGMCPRHRMRVLEKVRQRLEADENCYLISTQLIEAGVDVDFPLVMRELAPLEAIIQSAGRCNREGKIPNAGGQTIIFRSEAAQQQPQKYYPPDRWYKAGRETLNTVFLRTGRAPRIDNPEDIRLYYQHLYWCGDLDPRKIVDDRRQSKFRTVAENYRLIDDQTVPMVIATWSGQEDEVEELLNDLRRRQNRGTFRALIPFQVQIRKHQLEPLKALYAPLNDKIDLLIWRGKYDDFLGLLEEQIDSDFVV